MITLEVNSSDQELHKYCIVVEFDNLHRTSYQSGVGTAAVGRLDGLEVGRRRNAAPVEVYILSVDRDGQIDEGTLYELNIL